ncbi:MAG TPA: hypothetical protein VN881_03355, partial [Candidatus Acidoferrales bacterium]|nr:hypothetical protein [Candidatus Acidoferrales bacterium]
PAIAGCSGSAMIDQGERMRPRFVGADHDGLEALLSSIGGGNAQFSLDQILSAGGKGESLEREEKERKQAEFAF